MLQLLQRIHCDLDPQIRQINATSSYKNDTEFTLFLDLFHKTEQNFIKILKQR